MITLTKVMGTPMEEGLWQNNPAKVETLLKSFNLGFHLMFSVPNSYPTVEQAWRDTRK